MCVVLEERVDLMQRRRCRRPSHGRRQIPFPQPTNKGAGRAARPGPIILPLFGTTVGALLAPLQFRCTPLSGYQNRTRLVRAIMNTRALVKIYGYVFFLVYTLPNIQFTSARISNSKNKNN